MSYLFVRGARGHTFYLGLTAFFVWEYAVGTRAVDSASQLVGDRPVTGGSSSIPSIDTKTVAGVSLIFAIVYYLIAWDLDRTGRQGMACRSCWSGSRRCSSGPRSRAGHQAGRDGIVLLLVGLVLCLYGARYGRRFTAWFWGLVSAAGAVMITTKFATPGLSLGITMVVLGVVFAIGGRSLRRPSEPDDMAEVASCRIGAGRCTAPLKP